MKLRIATICLTIAALAIAGSISPSATPLKAKEPVEARVADVPESDPAAPIHLPGPGTSILSIDPGTHAAHYRIPNGILSPTADRVYSSAGRWVRVIDASTGATITQVRRPTGLELQVASTSGELLAFTTPLPEGATEWVPGGRKRTQISVVPSDGGRALNFDLKGNFVPEAFATNDRELFLIEYMPASSPWHYGLRRLILKSGAIKEISREKQGAPGEMNGTGRLAVFSPAGHELYTLYTEQGFNYTHVDPEEAKTDEVYAFVHLLNLNGAWTHCIDLPAPFGTGTATTHGMAVAPDGTALFVADPSSGGLARIDPITSVVEHSTTAELGELKEGIAAAVGSDGVLYLAGRTKILVFDGGSLEPTGTIPVPEGHPSVAVSQDGTRLFVDRGERVLVFDSLTGARL